jgi:hypothetical protein
MGEKCESLTMCSDLQTEDVSPTGMSGKIAVTLEKRKAVSLRTPLDVTKFS